MTSIWSEIIYPFFEYNSLIAEKFFKHVALRLTGTNKIQFVHKLFLLNLAT